MDMVDSPSVVEESGSFDSTIDRRKSKQPKYSRFKQQELPSCMPLITPELVILMFFFICAFSIPIGVLALCASRGVVEIVNQYETDCIPLESRDNIIGFIQSSRDKTCNRTLSVPMHMKRPINVYYQLNNFHQNHRRYINSRSEKQLRSQANEAQTKTCRPEDRTADGMPIVPCGLIAWSLFNDTYNFSLNKQPLVLNRKHISWKTDRNSKFGKDVYPKNFQNGPLIGGGKLDASKPLSKQEDLIVWMRPAALPDFRKLYGKIEEDLQAGDTIDVTVENNYNAYIFYGKKKLVLSTSSWLGGKNDFLGLAYLAVGGLSFILAMIFSIIFLVVKPRKLGDASLFSWNNNDAEYS